MHMDLSNGLTFAWLYKCFSGVLPCNNIDVLLLFLNWPSLCTMNVTSCNETLDVCPGMDTTLRYSALAFALYLE